MQNQFNKLLLATVIGASLVTTVYGANDGSAAIALEQRAGAAAEQTLQGSLTRPLMNDKTLGTEAAAINRATQNISAATKAVGALQQEQTADLNAADLNASAVADDALMTASELSGEGGNVQGQIQASATSTTDAVTSGLRGTPVAVVDGANSGRAEIASYSSVAGKVAQSGQAATANLSEQTSAAIQNKVNRADTVVGGVVGLSQAALGQTEISETNPVPALPVDGALPAAPGTSLPTPEVTVNGTAQADISGAAGLTTDTQRLNLNTQQRMQTDVGFNSSGRGSANTALGSSTAGSVGGLTSGVSALGAGSLLR